MSSLFVTFKSLYLEFLSHKTELVCSFSITEDTEVIVNSIDDDVRQSEYERPGALIDRVES